MKLSIIMISDSDDDVQTKKISLLGEKTRLNELRILFRDAFKTQEFEKRHKCVRWLRQNMLIRFAISNHEDLIQESIL